MGPLTPGLLQLTVHQLQEGTGIEAHSVTGVFYFFCPFHLGRFPLSLISVVTPMSDVRLSYVIKGLAYLLALSIDSD